MRPSVVSLLATSLVANVSLVAFLVTAALLQDTKAGNRCICQLRFIDMLKLVTK